MQPLYIVGHSLGLAQPLDRAEFQVFTDEGQVDAVGVLLGERFEAGFVGLVGHMEVYRRCRLEGDGLVGPTLDLVSGRGLSSLSFR